MFLSDTSQFIDTIYTRLTEKGLDTSDLRIDHLGYQAGSAEDYDQKITEVSSLLSHKSESTVGGRRVGHLIVKEPVHYKETEITVFEIVEPKEGEVVESAWEHIEFLTDFALEQLMAKYPNLAWNTRAQDREEFPMLILDLGSGLRAKFPRRGLLEELNRQGK